MKADSVLNGIDTARMTATVDAIKKQPALARFEFRAKNQCDARDMLI